MKNINETKIINNTNEGDATMKNNTNFKGLTIKTRKQFDRIAHDIFGARGGKGYKTYQIIIDKEIKQIKDKKYDILNFDLNILPQPWNKATNFLDIKTSYIVEKILYSNIKPNRKTGGTIVEKNLQTAKIERFTFDELHIQCLTSDAASALFNTYKRFLIKGRGESMLICLEDKHGQIIDICKKACNQAYMNYTYIDKIVPRGIFYRENGTLKKGVYKYDLGAGDFGYQVSSKSAIKKKDILIYESSNPEKTKNRLNLVCNGVYDQLLNSNSSKTYLTIEEITKLAGRLALYMPPAGLVNPEQYHLKCVAVYTNKYKDNTGNAYMDGMHWGAAESLADACNMVCTNKYKVLPDACVGVHAQDRPYTANKSMVEFMYRKELSIHLRNTIKMTGEKPIILIRGKVTKEQQKLFNEALISKKGPYRNKVIIIADPDVKNPIEEIDSLSDMNALKTSWDLNTKTNWHILKFVHLKHGHNNANISEQLLDCMFLADYSRTMSYMQNLITEKLNEKIEYIKNIQSTLKFNCNLDLQGGLDLATKLIGIAPEYILKYNQALYRAWANTQMESAVKLAKEIKISVTGQYLTACPDKATKWHNTKLLGIKLDENGMPNVEVICKAAEKDAIERLIAIKYPKMGPREFLKCKVITIKEYCNRVNKASDLTDIEKMYLKKDVLLMSDGMIMIPSIEILKKQAAGLDFDIDSMSCFFEKEIVNILWSTPMLAVDIESDNNIQKKEDTQDSPLDKLEHIIDEKTGEKKFVLNSKAGLLAYYSYCINKNRSVGEVTIMNNIFIQLFHMLNKKAEPTKIEKKFAQQAFVTIFSNSEVTVEKLENPDLLGREKGVGVSKFAELKTDIVDNIPVHFITEDYCNKFVNGCRCMSYGKDYIPEALFLLTDLQRYYQENTIDAAGNGKNVNIAYDANDSVKLKSRISEFDLRINWEGKKDCPFRGYSVSKDYFHVIDSEQTNRKTIKYYDAETKTNKEKIIFELKDTTQKLREFALPKLQEIASVLKANQQDSCPQLSDKIDKIISDARYNEIKAALYSLRAVYNVISDLRKNEINSIFSGIKSDLSFEREMRQYVSRKYRPFYRALSNSIRILLKDYSLEEKILLMQYISDRKMKEGTLIVDEASNDFVHRTLPEEFLLYVTKEFGEIKVTKDDVIYYKDVKEGDILQFVNGIGTNKEGGKAITKANINGEFIIGFERRKAYVVKSIESSVVVPEIDYSTRLLVTAEDNWTQKAFGRNSENELSYIDQIMNEGFEIKLKSDKKAIEVNTSLCPIKYKSQTTLEDNMLYKDLKGTISKSIMGFTSRHKKVALLIVSNVETMQQEEVEELEQKVITETKENIQVKTEVKSVHKGSKLLQAMRNNLNNQNIEENKEVKKDKKPLTLMEKILAKYSNKASLFNEIIKKEEPKAKESSLLEKLRSAKGSSLQ